MEELITKKYELTFWLKDEDASPVKKVLEKRGAEISAEKPLAKFRLSYPIKKEANAVLGSVAFAMAPAAIAGLTAELNAVPGVLRFVVNAASEHETGAARAAEGTAAPAARGRGGFFRRERTEAKPVGEVLTNEALEKKIEEISQ
jgi:ribosomal protein S6